MNKKLIFSLLTVILFIVVGIYTTVNCSQRPALKTVSCYTDKNRYIEDELVNIYIRNNRCYSIHGLHGNTGFEVIYLRTGEVVFYSIYTYVLSTMAPHQVNHHVWAQEYNNGTKVPPGKYIIFGGFSPYEDIAIIEIISDENYVP
jgi:hypothetical protein